MGLLRALSKNGCTISFKENYPYHDVASPIVLAQAEEEDDLEAKEKKKYQTKTFKNISWLSVNIIKGAKMKNQFSR